MGTYMSAMIGLRVRVKMAPPLDTEHVGDLFAFDDRTGCVALLTIEANNNHTYRVLKSSGIASVECLSSVPNPDIVNIRLPIIDMDRLRAKEQKALAAEAKKRARIGVNVSHEAQEIFDRLSFTLPCVW